MRYLVVSADPVYAHHLAALQREAGRVADIWKNDTCPPVVPGCYLKDYGVDALVLDVSCAGRQQGAANVRRWRRACGPTLTVAVVHRRQGRADVPALLQAGADTCHGRDEDARILGARLDAAVRRRQGFYSARFSVPPLCLDICTGSLTMAGEPVYLTRMEAGILEVLMRLRGQVLSRQDILLRLHHELPVEGQMRTVDVIISRLRQKLRPWLAGEGIHTRWGTGFQFDIPFTCQAPVSPGLQRCSALTGWSWQI